MHSVTRSPEPAFFKELRAIHDRWDELDGGHRRQIRDALWRDFAEVCAYCEQHCDPVTTNEVPNGETIDHFRPGDRFPDLALDWLNLVYACHRCNQSKANKWPGYDDEQTDQRLRIMEARHIPPSEYVNPNAKAGRRPAHEFFNFDLKTGEILPAEAVSDSEWSSARRTIHDIDLNDSEIGENDPRHLCRQRKYQLYLLIEGVESLDKDDAKVHLMSEFTKADKPFSTFIRAYLLKSFPQFREILFPVDA